MTNTKQTAIAVQQDSVIANMVRASTALAEAKTIQQTKTIADVAAAAEIYAKRQQLGEEAIGIAHSIKLEALRKLGEMLKETPKAKARFHEGNKKEPSSNDAPTLAELGLDKKTSSIAQKLADLPDEAFEQVREGHESIAKAIAAVKETKPAKPSKPVLVSDELTKLREENEALREANAEQGQTIKELLAENEIVGASDQLAAAMAECKKLRELVRVLEERNRGMQNEKNQAIRSAQSWQRKFERAQKAA